MSQFYFATKIYIFRTVSLPIIRSLFTVHSDQDGTAVPSRSCSKAVYKPVWHITFLSVQWIKLLMMDRRTVRNM